MAVWTRAEPTRPIRADASARRYGGRASLDAYGVLVDARGALPDARRAARRARTAAARRTRSSPTTRRARRRPTRARFAGCGIAVAAGADRHVGQPAARLLPRARPRRRAHLVLGTADSLDYVARRRRRAGAARAGHGDRRARGVRRRRASPFVDGIELALSAVVRAVEAGRPPALVLPEPRPRLSQGRRRARLHRRRDGAADRGRARPPVPRPRPAVRPPRQARAAPVRRGARAGSASRPSS